MLKNRPLSCGPGLVAEVAEGTAEGWSGFERLGASCTEWYGGVRLGWKSRDVAGGCAWRQQLRGVCATDCHLCLFLLDVLVIRRRITASNWKKVDLD